MKPITAILTGILGSELAWNWYSGTAIQFGEQILLLALAFATVLMATLCFIEVPEVPEGRDYDQQ